MSQFGSGLGQKISKGAVSITNCEVRIRLRWRYLGERYSISLSAYNQLNLLQAKKTALQIEQDIITGNFDVTLLKYSKNKAVLNKKAAPAESSFVTLFENWTKNYKQMDCEIHTNYNSTRNMIKKWGRVKPDNVLGKLNKEIFCAGNRADRSHHHYSYR